MAHFESTAKQWKNRWANFYVFSSFVWLCVSLCRCFNLIFMRAVISYTEYMALYVLYSQHIFLHLKIGDLNCAVASERKGELISTDVHRSCMCLCFIVILYIFSDGLLLQLLILAAFYFVIWQFTHKRYNECELK